MDQPTEPISSHDQPGVLLHAAGPGPATQRRDAAAVRRRREHDDL
ncbi:MAG TPA: hypothetical protein VFA46_16905 [Actinomycetes bacterium]|nr:hypothetical protein [Actinomycetes bacterium]